MSRSLSARFADVSSAFTDRVAGVPEGAWEDEAPCEGWVARDVVRHLVEWVPGFLASGTDLTLAPGPSVDDDPLAAWTNLRSQLQALLDDPSQAASTFSHPRAGTHRLDEAIGMFVLGDVLVHTWDLARATGQDEALDPEEVRGMLAGVEAMGDALAESGQYGRPVPVPEGADAQTRLIAFTGRTP
jgi:uncharacterized protein (TIGR03086 family)